MSCLLGQDEDASSREERADDGGRAVLPTIQTLVSQEVFEDTLDDRAHGAQA